MKVVVTGRGLVTPIGNGLPENERSLKEGRTGTVFMPEWEEVRLESQVAGNPDGNPQCPLIDKKTARFTTPGGKMAVAAAYEAVMEAGYGTEGLRGKNVAVVLGNGGSTFIHVHEGGETLKRTGKVKRVTPFIVPRSMNSSATANISLTLGLKGETYSISSACASGSHAIMVATRLIREGTYDIVITGGSEEVNWLNALGFDAMRAISRKYNSTPEKASRPFDKERDGFVLAGGAGIIVLESEKHVEKRGARAIAEISGIAANSNAIDMVVPDSVTAKEVMAEAIADQITDKISSIGEKLQLRRNVKWTVEGTGAIASYIHMGGKVGVLLELGCEKAETLDSPIFKELAKDLTLHVAAAAPQYQTRDEVPAELIEAEQEIFRKQLVGKPEKMIENILIGKTNKFFSQICFVEQGFVKEDKVSITDFVAEKGKELGDTLTIKRYIRYQLGA